MVGRSVRFLAPIALAAVALGVYLIVHSTLVSQKSGQTTTSTVLAPKQTHKAKHHTKHAKFYVVKSGDTLSSISAKTGVSFATLTRLNP
jgi:LysM repeat protein